MKADQFVDEVFQTVTGMVERALAPVGAALAQMRADIKAIPAGKDGRDGRDGKDVDPKFMAELVDEFSRGLAGYAAFTKTPEEVLQALVQSVQGLDATLQKPVVPMFDDDGNVLELRRGA